MMLPLRNLLKSDVFEYNSSHVEAFEKVKRTISSAVMLRADSLFLGWGGEQHPPEILITLANHLIGA